MKLRYDSRRFNRFLSLYFGCVLLLAGVWYFYSLRLRVAVPEALVLFTLTFLGVFALFLIFRCIDGQIDTDDTAAFDPIRAFLILDFLFLGVQLLIVYHVPIKPHNDLYYVSHAAKNLVLYGPSAIHDGMPAHHHHYFYTYPNNHMILALLAGIYKIEYTLTGGLSDACPIFVNMLCLNFSLALVFATGEKLYGGRRAFFCAVKCLCFIPMFTYIPYFYTDSMAMPWLMASVYAYVCWRTGLDRGTLHSRSARATLTLGLSMLLLMIAYKVKGSAGLLLPAYLCDILVHNPGHQNKTARAAQMAWLIVVFALSAKITGTLLVKGLDLNEKLLAEYKFPMIHWVMMSASGDGGFHKADFLYTLSYSGQAAKTHADWIRLGQKLKDVPAFIVHMGVKIGRTWGDGMFRSAHYVPVFQHLSLRVLANILYFTVFFTTEWTFIEEGRSDKRLKGHSDLIKLALLFLALFLLLWESKSRYLVTFLPLWALI